PGRAGAGDEAEARLGHAVIERAAANPEILGETETQLLIQWIGRLGLEIG
ncbi:TetR/AcrR family transcriptional regulator, partial [Burkholderia multivorans]